MALTRTGVRRIAGMGAALIVALAASVAVAAAPAYAHTRSSAILNGCGSGFSEVSDGVRQVKRESDGKVFGEVILTYNSSTGRNCVVTRKIGTAGWHGVKSHMTAAIRVQGQDWDTNGCFCYHWESITKYARDKCVMYSGSITSPSGTTAGYGGRWTWGNCG